jgi:hypothetical protein
MFNFGAEVISGGMDDVVFMSDTSSMAGAKIQQK